ncbi:Tyrosine recombinase XerD [Clostridium vincentii]|uniref:Tyrosine recombinase XerD n=2 Tax=Clostridium vincentii TaxID=52704 RepID=A0A2T0BBS5_9CLOT|nr:Tyrosine recombinase XerD [Clostridium vincentii]
MKIMRSKTLKYKNYEYPQEILKLFDVELNKADRKRLHTIYSTFYDLKAERGYEYIIEDLYILSYKQKITTSQIALIYDVGVRTVQLWFKELGLNEELKQTAKTKGKNRDLIIPPLNNEETAISKEISENFGIESPYNSMYPSNMIDFLNYLETIKGKSINTINGYAIDLTLFFRFLKVYKGVIKDVNLEFSEIPINDVDSDFIRSIKLTDIYAFLSYVEKVRENGSYARARKVAALRSFYKFLQGKAKIIDDNPTLDLESPKINKRHPVYLTLDQSLDLLSSLNSKDKNYRRDHCILTLFLNCGMRLSELCSIKIDKIKTDTLTIIGKGNKERTVYLNEACVKTINNYMQVRDISKVLEAENKFLFISARNRVINKRTVELLVKKHIQNAGIVDGKYTPHKLRHTAATLMYKYGNVDIRSLQSILGHEDISTTQIYTHVDEESLREAVKSNPLSKL